MELLSNKIKTNNCQVVSMCYLYIFPQHVTVTYFNSTNNPIMGLSFPFKSWGNWVTQRLSWHSAEPGTHVHLHFLWTLAKITAQRTDRYYFISVCHELSWRGAAALGRFPHLRLQAKERLQGSAPVCKLHTELWQQGLGQQTEPGSSIWEAEVRFHPAPIWVCSSPDSVPTLPHEPHSSSAVLCPGSCPGVGGGVMNVTHLPSSHQAVGSSRLHLCSSEAS